MLKLIKFGNSDHDVKLGDRVELRNQVQEVVACQESGRLMLNIDADELAPGDLRFIKQLGLTISNPHTKEPVALGVEVRKKRKLAEALSDWLDDDDDDDDSGFFSNTGFIGRGSFSGGLPSFGGFGGGSFGGGGASRGF